MRPRKPKQYRLQLYIYISIYIKNKVNYGYQISSIFIGSRDTGYQLMYLQYQIWSMNSSTNKEIGIKPTAIENRLVAELTSRNSGTGPKCKWNSPLLCNECFRTTKTSAIIVIKSFLSQPWENFPGCWCSASGETHFHLRPIARVYKLYLNWHIENLCFTRTWLSFRPYTFNCCN